MHRFNNTVCHPENCILAHLYSQHNIKLKTYYCKLTACSSFRALMESIISYITDRTDDLVLWQVKHKELMWLFTRYYTIEELLAFFHPMTDEQVPFKSLVLTHYRKAEYTDRLAIVRLRTLYIPLHLQKRVWNIAL